MDQSSFTPFGALVFGPGMMVAAIFVLALILLWFLLPFAVFGTKAKLDEIVRQIKITNKELARIAAGLQQPSDDVPSFFAEQRKEESIPKNMMPAAEYARKKGMEVSKVVEMLQNGELPGRQYHHNWYVATKPRT